MDVSSTSDANNELNCERRKVEEEKCLLTEKLAKTKAKYEQALENKNHTISSEIERIKKNMEDQMRKELRSLKESQEKDTTKRKVGEKALLDNFKASIYLILKSDHKSGDHIGIGARLKNLQDEVTNYLPPTVNKKCGAAVSTDDTFGDWTLSGACTNRHVHFASTPIKPEVSNIQLTTPPCTPKEETIAESIL